MEEERRQILRMIEEGKISAEEGVRLLEALSADKGDSSRSGRKNSSTRFNQRSNAGSASDPFNIFRNAAGRAFQRKDRQPPFDKEKKMFQDWSDQASSFVDTAVKKVREMDLDFNFGPYTEVNHTFELQHLSDTNIEFSLENGSFEWKTWDMPGIKIDCRVKVYQEESEERASKRFLEDAEFGSEDGRLLFRTKSKALKVEAIVYAPSKRYESIKWHTFNGHLKGESIDTDRFSAKASNGSLFFRDVQASRMFAETGNGPITLQGGSVDLATLKTWNGSVICRAEVKDLEVEVFNGSVTGILSYKEDAKASIQAKTGNIDLELEPSARTDGHLETMTGTYHNDLAEVEILEEQKEFVQKSVRFMSRPTASPTLRLEALTKTGSITVKPKI